MHEGATCMDCGHVHTPGGCAGDPTPSDLWAGVFVSSCDCIPLCASCLGRRTIVDPISQEEEPYTCPDCGGSGLARGQVYSPASTGGGS